MKIELKKDLEHQHRHQLLHKYLDELVADFIDHNRGKTLNGSSIMDLMAWSAEQTKNPTKGS